MQKVILFSGLLLAGLIGSQILPSVLGQKNEIVAHVVKVLTMIGLAFIMIHVGYEFDVNKSKMGEYGWDYVVAATAAAFPWIFCLLYFVFVLTPSPFWGSWETWQNMSLASRFAAPTSAGVLFSMLVAGGLGGTWLFRKARILAIFDDLDTVLFMIPLKMMIVGLRWELGLVVLVMAGLLWGGWRYLHLWRIPVTWPWVLGYAVVIALVSEGIYIVSSLLDEVVSIHIEVLLPAFVLGCMIAKPERSESQVSTMGTENHHDILESPSEKRVATLVSAIFMVLVGLSMPAIMGLSSAETQALPQGQGSDASWSQGVWIAFHVLVVTIISNLGKMFPTLCYRREAHWKHRLAVSVGMFPRGEVGAGVLIISVSYGIGGPAITVAILSLALNLLLTGVFIVIVKKLMASARLAVEMKRL